MRRLILADPIDVRAPGAQADPELSREWLVTNGLGGYASGTISGAITRRFHGLLISSHAAPLGRMMMLNHLFGRVIAPDGSALELDAQDRGHGGGDPSGRARVAEFVLEHGLPVWRYGLGDGLTLEKRILMPYRQNTVHVTLALSGAGGPRRIELEPWLNFRPHEASLSAPLAAPYSVTELGRRYEVRAGADIPVLRLLVRGTNAEFKIRSRTIAGLAYGVEASRGYDASGDLYAPGLFSCDIADGESVTISASTEPWEVFETLSPESSVRCEEERRTRLIATASPILRQGLGAELVFAADQFIVEPPGRIENRTMSRACGDEARSVIAGYHWFTDWGRDTMISLEGLTLVTGRYADARNILATFARHVKDGLIPNMFPEGKTAGLYHTADATLWFFHALDRYLSYTGDLTLLVSLLPTFVSIAEHYAGGTRFGIAVDSRDGLVRQGTPDLPLTWMDAKVGDLVVTPRRGKAVEINALYYNALCVLAEWLTKTDGTAAAQPYVERARQLRASFNERFWCKERGCLYDIVDGDAGDDPAFRPNQLFAVSLPRPVLDESRWERVVESCEKALLTPLGLRSLAPGEPDFKAQYFGDLRARDLAYHQGTVWGWLIGPFVDAWLRVHPGDRERASGYLGGFQGHMNEACVGTISEIFDAKAPYAARGCVAQAWSVAEVLRLLVVLGDTAAATPA
jgi:predicted glycogen debranching enzyme